VSTWWGIAGGALALMLGDTVVSSQGAAGRVQGGFGTLANLAGDFIDPTKPAIPDRRTTTTPAPPPATGPTAVVPPVWATPAPTPASTPSGAGGTEGVGKGG
jgi:hypothetical protein